jgi:hypothetical protein
MSRHPSRNSLLKHRIGGGASLSVRRAWTREHRQNDSIFPARAAGHQRFVDALAAAGSSAVYEQQRANQRKQKGRREAGLVFA